jgi:acetylornithine/N-succinyldiaminopimelate aminotransferase
VLSRIDEKLLLEVRQKSEYIFNTLKNAKGIISVSGMGLMIGIETARPASDIINECIDAGVLPIKAKNKIRLLPALNIPFDLLQKGIEILKEICAK